MRFAMVLAVLASGCGDRERLEPLGVDSRHPGGGARIEMMLRTGGRQADVWVARVHRGTAAPVDVTMPSFPSNEGDRSVSQRRPRIVWDRTPERALVETIRSGFVVLYMPPDSAPFVCEHRIVDPEGAHEAMSRTPTLVQLQREILTEDDKPHDPEEQEYVIGRIERAGPTSEEGAPLVAAILRSSPAVDRGRLERLCIARLRAGSGLDGAVRDSELARLRTTLVDFAQRPDHDHALLVPRVARILGAMTREDGAAPVVAALGAAIDRTAVDTAMADVLPAVAPLAWLAGKWQLAEAAPALLRYLQGRSEVPFQTRVARNLALWAAVRIDARDAIEIARPLVEDPIAWTAGGDRSDVPDDATAEQSPAWADDTPLGVTYAWAAKRLSDVRAVPTLRSILGHEGLPEPAARAAARALLALDESGAPAVVRASPSLTEAAKSDLLGR